MDPYVFCLRYNGRSAHLVSLSMDARASRWNICLKPTFLRKMQMCVFAVTMPLYLTFAIVWPEVYLSWEADRRPCLLREWWFFFMQFVALAYCVRFLSKQVSGVDDVYGAGAEVASGFLLALAYPVYYALEAAVEWTMDRQAFERRVVPLDYFAVVPVTAYTLLFIIRPLFGHRRWLRQQTELQADLARLSLSHKLTLDEVLEDAGMYKQFVAHANRCLCGEMLVYWAEDSAFIRLHHLEDAHPDPASAPAVVAYGRLLVDKYVAADSAFELNVPDTMRKQMILAVAVAENKLLSHAVPSTSAQLPLQSSSTRIHPFTTLSLEPTDPTTSLWQQCQAVRQKVRALLETNLQQSFLASKEFQVARTAALVSSNNPYFFNGSAGSGIGGPHAELDSIWSVSLIIQTITSTDDSEIRYCLKTLMASGAGTGWLHESFDKNDVRRSTRRWFAWVNGLFGSLILQLAEERPYLIFKHNTSLSTI